MTENEPPERRRSGTLRTSWTNLVQPGSLRWKITRFTLNNAGKLVHRRGCCGHPGEPGC